MRTFKHSLTPIYLSGVLLLSIGLTACGSSSSSTPVSEVGVQSNSSVEENSGATSSIGNDPVTASGDDFIVLESNGIKVEMPAPNDSMIDFDLIEVSDNFGPEIDFRVTNNSDGIIASVQCTVAGFKDGVQVDRSPRGIGFRLRPGDTIAENTSLSGLDGLDELDTIRLMGCEWKEAFESVDNPLINVELIEYTTDESGNVIVSAQLTNNSDSLLFGPLCVLAIRKGNEILDNVYMQFEDGDDEIGFGPGGPHVTQERVDVELEEFDSDEFILDDLHCGFLASV